MPADQEYSDPHRPEREDMTARWEADKARTTGKPPVDMAEWRSTISARAERCSAVDRQAAFVAASGAVLLIAGCGVIAIVTGQWEWVVMALMVEALAGLLLGVVLGLFKLAEWLFPDRGPL